MAKNQKRLEMKVFNPAQVAWAAPIVFTPKKEISLIFGVDYRKLEAVSVHDLTPYHAWISL